MARYGIVGAATLEDIDDFFSIDLNKPPGSVAPSNTNGAPSGSTSRIISIIVFLLVIDKFMLLAYHYYRYSHD